MLCGQSDGEAVESRRRLKGPISEGDFAGQAVYAFRLEIETWIVQRERSIDLELDAELSMANGEVLQNWRTEANLSQSCECPSAVPAQQDYKATEVVMLWCSDEGRFQVSFRTGGSQVLI